MYIKIFIFFTVYLIVFNNADSDYNGEEGVECFIEMVRDNITAASNFVLPVDNRKLSYVRPSENGKIYDYGEFDFVIIGGGSAGTLLASRLSEIKNWSVLLLESGGPGNDFSDIPGMNTQLFSSDMNWGYKSTPQKRSCLAMEEQRCVCPRGKVLGGSSTINSKMFVRGNKEDFNEWEAMGNPGWSYEDILPYFIKTEHSDIHNGDIGYHGVNGLLHINYTEPTIFTSILCRGLEEIGLEILDYNGEKQIGASQVQFSINGNKIASGERAFIDPFINRRNLNVTLNAFVTKLSIDKDTKTASGAEFIMNGKNFSVRASKEVILSAGAINSPQILMLSGIGPKQELDKLGIDTLLDLPVGRNMEDHVAFIGLKVRTNYTLFNESIETMLKDYLNDKRPLTAPSNIDVTSFMNVNDGNSTVPDIQHIFMVPPGITGNSQNSLNLDQNLPLETSRPYNDIQIWIILLHPKSKGTVTLKSKLPVDFPEIDYNYFAEEEDIHTMYKGVLETLKLLDTKPLKSINATYSPVAEICTEFPELSKEYWYCLIRHFSTTLFHPTGTTRMGNSETDSVVCPKLRVHGMNKLRVVDAGTIPKTTSGNINAPTYMIAEKAADEIKHYFKEI